METSYVLSGLSRKAGLCLLSLSKTSVSHLKVQPSSDKEAQVVNDQKYPVVTDCSSCIVGNSSTEAGTEEISSHKPENLPHLKKSTDVFVNDISCSTFGKSGAEAVLSHKPENLPIVEKCTDNCRSSTVAESSTERVLCHKPENLPNIDMCPISFNSVSRDCSSLPIGESGAEAVLSNKPEYLPNVEKCTDLSINVCSREKISSHKPENPPNVKECADFSVNNCSGLTDSHCDPVTLPEDKMQEDDEDEYICVTDDETDRPCSGSNWDTSDDLPLMANVDEVLVTHYVLNLGVSFEEKVMSGDITLFLKPASEIVAQRQFQLCLDCSLVDIESVEEINLKDDFSVTQYGGKSDDKRCSYPPDIFQVDKFKKVPVALPYTFLPYAVRNWCVRIWKPRELGTTWPRCVRIKYCTRPEGKSLTWTTDQDNRYVEL